MSWRSASRRIVVPRFLPVSVNGRELWCHDEVVKMIPSRDKWTSRFYDMIKLARWRVKIVTGLLPQPSVLDGRSNFF